MAMRLVDSGVAMVPNEQCNCCNLTYIHTSPYSDSDPKESHPRHDEAERNLLNNSHTNHYADNAEHWTRPFGK